MNKNGIARDISFYRQSQNIHHGLIPNYIMTNN
jgi:hypothetical protein